MKILYKITGSFFLIFFLILINFIISYLLPYPFSQINSIVGALLLILFWKGSGDIIWLGFFSYILVETYAISPYGIILFSGTLALLITFWGYKYVFSNNSIVSVAVLTLFSITTYRFLYFLCIAAVNFFWTEYVDFSLTAIIATYVWETVLTTAYVLIIYGAASWFTKRTRRI